MKNVRKYFKTAISLLCSAILIISLLIIISFTVTTVTTGKATVFGYRPMIVLTNSMLPVIKPGNVIIGIPVDAGDVELGDVVAYKKNTGSKISPMIVHRVVSIEGELFIFKGDNNKEADEPVTASQIMYKIIY